jgi:hypothetical protein
MRAPTLLATCCVLLAGCADSNVQDESTGGGSGTTIVGATVIDGTGAPALVTAVRIVGDRIEAMGDLEADSADTVIGGADGFCHYPLAEFFAALEATPMAVNLESARFAVTEVSTPAVMPLAHFAPEPNLAGKTLEEIAAERGTDPATTLVDLIREAEEYRDETGEESVESVIAVSMTEEDIDHLLRWPWVNICTDGELWGSHPRGFGSFTRVLGHYVRERQTLSLEEAIHKMTGRAAADLVLFDPLTVADRATTYDPHRDSAGIHKVWVNGELVWDAG